MSEGGTITPIRMAVMIFVFNTASTIIFIPSALFAQSGNAFWIAWAIAAVYGLMILFCMLLLLRRYPGQTLVEAGIRTVGYGFTAAAMLPYILFCVLLCTYIYFTVGSFFTTTMMRETPSAVFNGLMALVAAVTARAGLRTMARMFSLLNIMLIGAIAIVLLLSLKNYHPEYLLPVMPNGLKPALHSAYLSGGFVYGDFLVFAMLFGFIRREPGEKVRRPIFIAFALNWITLVLVMACIMMALGPVANDVRYPIFSLARIIRIKEIIERGESVIGMSLIAGSFMKSTVTLYALNITLCRLIKLRDEKVLIYPLTLLCFYFSLVIVPIESQYAEVLLTWPMVTFVAGLPLWAITIAAVLRGRGQGRRGPSPAKQRPSAAARPPNRVSPRMDTEGR